MTVPSGTYPVGPALPVSVIAMALLLGLAVGGVLPERLFLPVIAVLPVALCLVVLLLPTRQAIPAMAGICIVATSVASSRFSVVAQPLGVGRFVFPAMVLILAAKSGLRFGATTSGKRLVAGAVALVGSAGFSVAASKSPGLSALKTLALALVLLSVIALVQWAATRKVSLRRPVLIALTMLSVSNLLFLPLGAASFSGSRFRGWTINPNTLGILCALTIPVLAAEAAASRGRRRHAFLCTLVVVVATILLSGSRGGALAAALGTAAVLRSTQVVRSAMFPIVLVTTLFLTPWALQSGSQSGFLNAVDRRGDSGRDAVWSIAVTELKLRPATGTGFATTEERFANAEFGRLPVFQGGHFHNSYLEAAVELGLPGALPLALVGLFALSHLVRLVPPESIWAAGVAVAGATVAIFETGALTAGAVVFFPFWLATAALALSPSRTRVLRRSSAASAKSGRST